MRKKQPLLSILILSVLPRYDYLQKLMRELRKQILRDKLQHKIEIVLYVDNFEKTVGEKTQILLNKCNGKYACGIGDDDEIHENYCKEIINAIETTNADHITFGVKVIDNKKDNHTRIDCSIHNTLKPKYIWGWPSLKKGKFWGLIRGIRYYTHTFMAVKLEKIKEIVDFPHINTGSDEKYYDKVYEKKLLKTEHKIEKDLYVYHMDEKVSLCNSGTLKFNRLLAQQKELPKGFLIPTEGINVVNIFKGK